MEMIGVCGLVYREKFALITYEIGYWIIKSHEGKGYITEACKRLLKYGIEILGAKRFTLCSEKLNARSCRIADKLGFKLLFEGDETKPNGLKIVLWNYEKVI